MTAGIRALHLVPLPPPLTGIGVSVLHLLDAQALRTQSNTVVNISSGTTSRNGPRSPTPRRILRHARLAMHVGRLVRDQHIEVVHLHGSSHDLSFVGNWFALQCAARAGARTLWHLHEDLDVVRFPGKDRVARQVFGSLASRVDALAVLTGKDRDVAGELIERQRIVVIPETCGAELLEISLERRGAGFRVLFVGWLSHAKGIYDLIQVADATRRQFSGVVFDVLGTARSAREQAAITREIESRDLRQQVILHGLTTGADKLEAFAHADVLFMPTHWDAFPVTVLEAMASGLPVVGTRVGGLPHMLEEGSGGFLCPVGDTHCMTRRLVELAESPDVRQRMGTANRATFARRYHPDAVGLRTVGIYDRLIHGTSLATVS